MTIQRQKQNNSALWLVLGGAFVLRMILAGVTEGYPYDMSCFVAWGEKLLADGPAGFYSGGYFADYPPGYLFVLGGGVCPAAAAMLLSAGKTTLPARGGAVWRGAGH